MARYQFLVLTSAVPGRVEEFDDWYDNRHLAEVVAVPGVVSARRYKVLGSMPNGLPDVGWTSFAIYEIDADDPQVVVDRIGETSQSGAMMISDTLRMEPVLTMIAQPAGEHPAPAGTGTR